MTIYFSATTCSFYNTDVYPENNLPEDCVIVEEETYKNLMEQQNAGYVIVAGSDGNPTVMPQSCGACNCTVHEKTVATKEQLGHVKIDGETLDLNEDGELSIVGGVGGKDYNTGDKVYDWIGTKAEYEEQQIETLHPEYLCFITDDETPIVCATRSLDNLDEAGQAKFDAKADVSALDAKIDREGNYTVVETYKNGTEWYRVWSDGWIEQGGCVIASYTGQTITLNMLKSFSDVKWTIVTTVSSSTLPPCLDVVVGQGKTNNTIGIVIAAYGENNNTNGFYWYACGY